MDLGSLGGGLAGGVLSYLGAQSTNDMNKEIAQNNNAWSAQQYATRYQTEVKDLQAAGLNPMLAYTLNAGSAPTAQQVTFQNPLASAVQGFNETSGQIARSAHEISSAHHADSSAKQADAAASKIAEETKNVPFAGDQIRHTVQLLAEQAANYAQDTENKTWIRKQIQATIEQMKIQTKSMKLDVDAAESLDNIGRTSKELKPIVDMIRSFFPTYHYHFGGRIPQ